MPASKSGSTGAKFSVLVVVARPLDIAELPSIADQWALVNGLAAIRAPARIDILRPPTIESLRQKIQSGYDILHFDGHGVSSALLCPNPGCKSLSAPGTSKCEKCGASLEGVSPGGFLSFDTEDGLHDPLAAEDLADIIRAGGIRLAILSACESALGGEQSLSSILVRERIPAVVGMREVVPVYVTVALSESFYAALGAGKTIAEAFKISLPALGRLPKNPLTGTPAQEIPALAGDGRGNRLIAGPAGSGRVEMERELLIGVPEYDFVGEFIKYDPPKGRKGLLVQGVRALLQGEQRVIYIGQGGIGKTYLASAVAQRISWRFPGGVFWRSAADMENLGLNELLDAFSQPEVFGYEFRQRSLDIKRDMVYRRLRDQRTASLIVVDNAERIADEKLWSFLEGIPKPSAALVTSRDARPRGWRPIRVEKMEPYESMRLFVEEARRAKSDDPRWGENLRDDEISALEGISHLLDGHPLAIKLAAALLYSDYLEMINERLKRAPPKEISDRFDFSYNALTNNQMALLHRLAAFASSVPMFAIQFACAEPAFVGEDALTEWQDDLSELQRRSFVDLMELRALDKSDKEVILRRYRLHPLMRQYAALKAGEDAMAAYRGRAASLFLAYAVQFAGNYGALYMERENLLAGMDWAYAKEDWEMVKSYASVLYNFLDTRGYWKESNRRLNQAVTACRRLEDKSGVSVWQHNLGILAQKTGDLAEARRLYGESLKIEQELGDRSGVSISLHELGILEQLTCNFAEARRFYEESLKISQELGDRYGVSKTLHQLGMLAQDTGDLAEARRLYSESLKIQKEFGDRSGVSGLLHNLGALAQDTGDLAEARRLYDESLKIKQELVDKLGVSTSLCQLGKLAQSTGDIAEARRLYGESLKISQELGNRSGVSKSLNNLGALAQKTGDLVEARRLYGESLKISQELGDKSGVSSSLHQLGWLAQSTGDVAEARLLYGESLKIDQELGDKSGVAYSLTRLSLLEESEGNISRALELIRQAEAILVELGSPMVAKAKRLRELIEKKLK